MTGRRLEECLQGGQDAREVFKLLRRVLDGTVNCNSKTAKRIIAQPVDKDDKGLAKMNVAAVPYRAGEGAKCKANSKLEQTIIHLPVFFEGEWIVVCFQCLGAQAGWALLLRGYCGPAAIASWVSGRHPQSLLAKRGKSVKPARTCNS